MVMGRSAIAILGGCSWLTFSWLAMIQVAKAESLAPLPDLQQQVEEVASMLEGRMDTSAQASTNPKVSRVRMTTCRVRVGSSDSPWENKGAIFLYQEQALFTKLSQPYRQRFLQISPSSFSQTVRSRSFKPTTPGNWIGFCDKPESERVLASSDLGSRVCEVFLKRSSQSYLGNTPVDGCPANVRGAVRITNHIELTTSGMNTWDRGFDAQGKQVWGAQSDSYQFQRSK